MIYKNGILIGTLLIMLGVIMTATNPSNFSAPLFVVTFALIYTLVAAIAIFVLQILRALKIFRQSSRKLVKSGLIVAILPVFLLLLHSVGQLTVRDALLAVAFFSLLYVYFGRIGSKTRV